MGGHRAYREPRHAAPHRDRSLPDRVWPLARRSRPDLSGWVARSAVPFVEMAVVIRSPIAADAPRLAEAWLEFGRYYEAIDPSMFSVPDEEGLEGWIRTAIGGPPDEDRLWLVADIDGTVEGYVQAEIS